MSRPRSGAGSGGGGAVEDKCANSGLTMDWDPDVARIADPETMRDELGKLVAVHIVDESLRLRTGCDDYKYRAVSERLFRGLLDLRMRLDLHEGPTEAAELERLIDKLAKLKAEVAGGKPRRQTPPTSAPAGEPKH